ncbi:LppU/SCO3897 family protein [Lentzea sp. CA-135723]|uniref:LppU/SCO3897 family protein n=1 Tax=Lentzea sp. CA-135723 TaxID=3239950 RepID=UPI003D90D9D1
MGLLLVVALATAFFIAIGRNVPIATTTPTMTYAVPTTNPTPLPAPAQVGDCVKLTGISIKVDYEKVPCDSGQHNYTVSKVLGGQSEKCGDDPDAYTKYSGWNGRKSSNVCLIPVFADGLCYDFTASGLTAEIKPIECSFLVVRVKVLQNTADKAACGPDPALALAYPEIRTTYCFTQAE